jgi:hypothetical protein
MQCGDSSKLADMIKKAIRDCEVSSSEYNEILKQAGADSHIDAQEQTLLSQLQQMVANGTVKRVAG